MEDLTKRAWEIFRQVQEKRPLVQCITNFVTVNDCANMILRRRQLQPPRWSAIWGL